MTDQIDYSKTGPPRRSFRERLIGALRIDASVYEEVEHSPDALFQAAGVIAIAAVARGLGGFTEAGFFAGVIGAFVSWGVGTAVIYLIGVVILDHTSDFRELLRTLGFASAPQVLFGLGIVPLGPLRGVLWLGVIVLGVFAWVVAIRQALDISTGRAAVIAALGALPSLLWAVVFGGMLIAG